MTTPCRNHRRCVGFDRTGNVAAAVLAGVGPLCRGCLGRASADITALGQDYAGLAAEIVPAGAAGGVRVSGGDPDAPVPLALAVEELQRDIVWALTTWEPPVREAAGLRERRSGAVRDAWAVATAVRVLTAHVAVLAALGPTWGYAEGLDAGPVERDGVYALAQLGALHVRAQAALGQRTTVQVQPGPCPWCSAPALRRDDGSDVVICAACDHRMSFGDYQDQIGLASPSVAP